MLWCDDKMVTNEYSRFMKWIRLRKHDFDENLNTTAYVLKSNSTTTRSYLMSPFFKISLAMSDSFRFLQNSTRANENTTRMGKDREIIDENQAGYRLLLEFREMLKEHNERIIHGKVESSIFSNDKKIQ